jgi:predicted DNA-binding protein
MTRSRPTRRKQFRLVLTDAEHARLAALAKRVGKTMADVLREGIDL